MKIYIDHGEAYGNLGDEAMLLSALARLENQFGKCHFILPREGLRPLPNLEAFDISFVPSPFAFFRDAASKLDAITSRCSRLKVFPPTVSLQSKVSFAHILARLTESKVIADKHGFLEVKNAFDCADAFYGVGAADFNDFNIFGTAYKCWLYGEVKRSGTTCAVSAQGFGPMDHPEMRGLMHRTIGNLDILSFRDFDFSKSYTHAISSGGSCPTKVVCDEAFQLEAAPQQRVVPYLTGLGLDENERYLAVHWRATDYVKDTALLYPRVAELFDLATASTGLRAVFVPMSYDAHSKHDDICCNEVRSLMKKPEALVMMEPTKDIALIKAVVGSSFCTLALSYHIHVFGLSQCVPAINVYSGRYYSFKAAGLIDFFGPPNVAVDLEASDWAKKVQESLAAISKDRDAVTREIKKRCQYISQVNNWTVETLAEFLSEE